MWPVEPQTLTQCPFTEDAPEPPQTVRSRMDIQHLLSIQKVPVTSVSTERRARDMTNCNLKTVVDAPESHLSFSVSSFQDWFSNKPGNILPPSPTQI